MTTTSTVHGAAPRGLEAERAAILTAALSTLLASDGNSMPVNEILAGAGLSTRAFYRHFGSKDALLLALFREAAERTVERMRAVADRASSPAQALHGVTHELLSVGEDPADRLRALALWSPEISRARGYAAQWHRWRAAHSELLADVVRAGAADGSFPDADPEHDPALVTAVLDQALLDRIQGAPAAGAGSAAENAARVSGFVLRALGAGATARA